MWAVMQVMKFSDLELSGINIPLAGMERGGPQRYIPVFDTKEEAEKFRGDADFKIAQVEFVTLSVTPQEGSDHAR